MNLLINSISGSIQPSYLCFYRGVQHGSTPGASWVSPSLLPSSTQPAPSNCTGNNREIKCLDTFEIPYKSKKQLHNTPSNVIPTQAEIQKWYKLQRVLDFCLAGMTNKIQFSTVLYIIDRKALLSLLLEIKELKREEID